MIRPFLLCLLCALGSFRLPAAERFADIFAPLATDTAALSPDGRRLAYSFRDDDQISILTLDVDSPARAKCAVAVAKDQYALGYMQRDFGNHPSRITWLGWTSASRVVVESDLAFLSTRTDLRGVIFGFDHDGANARILYSAREVSGAVHIYGLLRDRANSLFLHGAQDWCLLSANSAATHPLDRHEFASVVAELQVQQDRAIASQPEILSQLAPLFPGREITLLPHFGPSPRVLACVASCADPGSYVVFDPETQKAWNLVRRAPARESIRSHRLETFDLTDERGARFTGALMLPLNPRMKKAPLVLWMPERLGARVRRVYHPEVEALASMGFAVAVVDGLAWRSAPDGDPTSAAFPIFHSPSAKPLIDGPRRRTSTSIRSAKSSTSCAPVSCWLSNSPSAAVRSRCLARADPDNSPLTPRLLNPGEFAAWWRWSRVRTASRARAISIPCPPSANFSPLPSVPRSCAPHAMFRKPAGAGRNSQLSRSRRISPSRWNEKPCSAISPPSICPIR